VKIAVIGSGISGLAAAWILNRRHEVHLFERRSRLGGHTNTVLHEAEGRPVPLDTGFIVFNHATYPNLRRVFRELGIESQPSDMSFSVSSVDPDFEYASHSVRGLFAQPQLLRSVRFLRLLVDVFRFGRRGRRVLAAGSDPRATVADFLNENRFSEDFSRYFLLPMVSAIWSSGAGAAADYPRDALLRFFANHGLLQLANQPQWRTVVGGSMAYVEPMTRGFRDRVHLGRGVKLVHRAADAVSVELEDGSKGSFDHVVIAAHADQALGMLAEPTADERELLGCWEYSVNDTWLHTDTSLMPRRRAAWASWNYLMPGDDAAARRVSVSYHLNRLQQLDEAHDYLVTLNPHREPAPGSVIRRMQYSHPMYSTSSIAAQPELPRLNGRQRTHFCGAYFGNGFHEDGLAAALAVADDLGVTF
jgi:predicted NAD/FAD-binding protein